jgi:Flp pilus assembly protein TadD
MAAQDYRFCPECGSRNKIKWELCVRCGQSLQDVPAGAPAAAVAEVEADPAAASGAANWFIIIGVLVVAVGLVIWSSKWRLGGQPDSNAFTFGTVPGAAPSASPTQTTPTAAKFAEARRRAAAKDIDGAILLFDQVMQEEPGNADYHYGYAQALWDAGRRDVAMAQFREAAQLSPPLRVLFARHLRDAGQTQEALREYEAAFGANPGDVTSAGELGTALNEAGQYARAAEVFGSIPATARDSQIKAGLALALEKSGNVRGAIDLYRTLLDEDKGRAVARARLADLMASQGDTQGAIKLYQEGLSLTPSVPLLHQGLGNVYEDLGRVSEAIAEYRECIRLAPNSKLAKALTERTAELEKLGKQGS